MADLIPPSIAFEHDNHGLQVGHSNAPIHATIQLPPERKETTPSPTSTVPFIRDPDYIDRPAIRQHILARLSTPGARVALVGLGGAGKTQLAVDCAQSVRKESPQTWVLWIHAGTAARFEQSIRDIADATKFDARNTAQADIFKLFHSWLRDAKNGKWMIVLDNTDNPDYLLALPASTDSGLQRRLYDDLPACEHGSVLITSRSKTAARRLVISPPIEIQPMEIEYARKLLATKLGVDENEVYEQLAAALDFLPLAMAQAAAYIHERKPRCSAKQYLGELENSRKSRASLLLRDERFPDREYDQASSSILVTWQISFEHIAETRPSAADLLSVMSFCDRQSIPEVLIRSDADSDDADDTFEDDVIMLRNFSFISATTDKSSWEMHRLVQDGMQTWLEVRNKYDEVHGSFLHCLKRALPDANYENWTRCQLIFPHAVAAASRKPSFEEGLLNWANVMYHASWYAKEQGQWAVAEGMTAASVQARISILGEDDSRTIDSMNMRGETLLAAWRLDEAEKLLVKAMEIGRTKLGLYHLTTRDTMFTLSVVYLQQGRLKEAEELQIRELDLSQSSLGPNDSRAQAAISNLAHIYLEQSRWKEAEELLEKLTAAQQTTLGPAHPDTLIDMAGLGSAYKKQGRCQEAEKLEIEALGKIRAILGPDHPNTLWTMSNLGCTYLLQGRFKEAEELQVEVLGIGRRTHGPDHPNTLLSMHNLALTYSKQGRLKEAEDLFTQALEGRTRVLGKDHANTLLSMYYLGFTYSEQGRLQEAEDLFTQALEGRTRVLGKDHANTLSSMYYLGFTYSEQGRLQEAEGLFTQALEGQTRVLGKDHANTLSSMCYLGFTYFEQGRLNEAEDLFTQALEGQTRVFGKDHARTAETIAELQYVRSLREPPTHDEAIQNLSPKGKDRIDTAEPVADLEDLRLKSEFSTDDGVKQDFSSRSKLWWRKIRKRL